MEVPLKRKSKMQRKLPFLENFCLYANIHGLKYVMGQRSLSDKLFWIVFVCLAVYGAANNIYRVWVTYDISETKTTISNIYHEYANVPFPSVTICESSRVDWKKVAELNMTDIIYDANNGEDLDEASRLIAERDVKKLISILAVTQFGIAKDVRDISNVLRYSARIGHISLSKLIHDLVRPCDELFARECWWRNQFYNCCDLFELQKTGYGYCYSFNSDISEDSKVLSLNYGLSGSKNNRWVDWNQHSRPRRAAGHGVWSGLRITVKLQDIPSYLEIKPGIIVITGDPSGFPFENEIFIPANKYANVAIYGNAVVTTERLKKIPPNKRRCLYPNEMRILNRGYLRQNCVANCFRNFLQDNCECALDLVYYRVANDSTLKECKVDNLQCLAEFNYSFSSQTLTNNVASNEQEETRSVCDCPDDCKSQKYIAKAIVESSASSNKSEENEVTVDIHYQSSFCTLFLTDIVFDFIDSLVYYGSIAGLFLGTSLLSLSQALFFLTSGLYHRIRDRKMNNRIFANSASMSLLRNDLQHYQYRNSLLAIANDPKRRTKISRNDYFKNKITRSGVNKIFALKTV